jgi:hypothetical protein
MHDWLDTVEADLLSLLTLVSKVRALGHNKENPQSLGASRVETRRALCDKVRIGLLFGALFVLISSESGNGFCTPAIRAGGLLIN